MTDEEDKGKTIMVVISLHYCLTSNVYGNRMLDSVHKKKKKETILVERTW